MNINWADLVVNTVANIMSSIILFGCGVMLSYAVLLANRERLFSFFGLNQKRTGIQIWLSRLQIVPGGTIATESIKEGYSGPALNELEYKSAIQLRDVFRSRALAVLPKGLQRWLTARRHTMTHLEPNIQVSPDWRQPATLRTASNTILIGSGVYNSLTKQFLESGSSFFKMYKTLDNHRKVSYRESRWTPAYTEIPFSDPGQDVGFIEKVFDTTTGSTTFVCAGIGACGTRFASKYLAENWDALHSRFGTNDFGIYFVVPTIDRNAEPPPFPERQLVVHPPEAQLTADGAADLAPASDAS